MIDRFARRITFNNSNKLYSKLLEDRGLNSIQQYNTAVIKYPNEQQLKTIPYIEHVWTTGDRLYKLSNQYFGDTKSWWIILQFNQIGSEVLIKQGDVIKIPANIEEVLGYFT
jgi:hypothetical protein